MDLSRHNENIKEGSLSSMLMAGLITKKKIHLVRCRELEKVICTKNEWYVWHVTKYHNTFLYDFEVEKCIKFR